MMKRHILILLLANFSVALSHEAPNSQEQATPAKPLDHYVKAPNNHMTSLTLDEATVIKIAEALLTNIYGERVLRQRPWIITQTDTTYNIKGRLHVDTLGGVAEITIRKSDAKVIDYSHGK